MKQKFEHLHFNYPNLEVTTENGIRFYVTPEGNKYPSVTSVVNFFEKDGIAAWKARVGEAEAERVSKRSTDIGTALHSLIERYLSNEDISEYCFGVSPVSFCFQNMKPYLDRITKIYGLEVLLYSDILRLAGRVDCIAEYDGKPHIIDFKQSKTNKEEDWITNYFLQAAAYSYMFEERFSIKIPDILIMIGLHDGGVQLFQRKRKHYLDELLQVNHLPGLFQDAEGSPGGFRVAEAAHAAAFSTE